MKTPNLVQYHPRSFREMLYVYPVISRRSGGLSIGVNLSPTARCNFACIYCQVLGELDVKLQHREQFLEEGDRKKDAQSHSPLVDIDRLEAELCGVIGMASDGSLFQDGWLVNAPADKREIRDIAFSGDGEPTLSKQFPEIVRRVAAIRKELCPASTKIVLITNGTTLDSRRIRDALDLMLENNGEIWAKLDAGTPEYYRTIARSTIPYEKILSNLTEAAREIPLVVQSCFLSLHGTIPDAAEIEAYADQIKRMLDRGGKIKRIQIYTVARHTPEPWVQALSNEQLDSISETVRRTTGLQVDSFYSS